MKNSIEDDLETLAITWAKHWRNLPMEEPIVQVEYELARLTGKKYCLAHSSGTMALLAAFFGVGVGPGDEVIVPALACSAVATPLLVLGAVPVFCDIHPRTLCMEPESVKTSLSERTRAICVVSLWGNICDMKRLSDLARDAGVALIEDCSQVPGARFHGKPTGSFGTVSVFSMQGSKALRGGEGGAIVTNSAQIYNRILVLGHHGRVQHCLVEPNKTMREMGETTLGLKLRPHALAMALALRRLKRLEQDNINRRRAACCYDQVFLDIPGVFVVRQYPGVERGGFFVEYPLIYVGDRRGGRAIHEVARRCAQRGLPVKIQRYPPLHLERTFRVADSFFGRPGASLRPTVSLPNVEGIAPRILSLPFFETADKALVREMANLLVDAMF